MRGRLTVGSRLVELIFASDSLHGKFYRSRRAEIPAAIHMRIGQLLRKLAAHAELGQPPTCWSSEMLTGMTVVTLELRLKER